MRVRRLLLALVLGSLAFGILLTGTGAAEAADDPGALDGTFAVAPSRPGDRAVYAIDLIIANEGLAQGLELFEDAEPGADAIILDGNARYELQRLGDRLLPLDGVLQPVSSFATAWESDDVAFGDWDSFYGRGGSYYGTDAYDPFSDFDPEDAFDEAGALRGEPWHVAHIDASHRVVATTAVGSGDDLPGRRLAADLGLEVGTTLLTRLGPGGAPCGFHSDLQDGPQPLSRPVRIEGVCPPPGGRFGLAPQELPSDRFLASGYDMINGQEAIVYGQESDAEAMRAWFTADVPYPVRMLVPLRLFETQDFGMHLLYQMTAFTPGNLPPAAAGPALAVLPTSEAGPDAQQVDHPFPLATALLAAQEDDQDAGTREFLAAHPGAVIDEARFARVRDGDQTQERWTFTLVGGGDALHVEATRGAVQDVNGIDPSVLPVAVPRSPVPVPLDDGVVVHSTPASAQGRAALGLRPLGLPTVRGLLDAWAADGGGGGVPSWAFHLRADGASWVAAGQAEAVIDRDGAQESTALSYSFLAVDASGRFAFVEESPGRYDVPGERSPDEVGPGYDSEQDGDYRDPRAFALASVGFWRFPEGKTAATAGAGAALLGLLAYALWPAKLGLGLFSRIGHDEVLEHPLRQQIAALVEAEPGIHFQELVRRLDAGRGTMEHHLRKLVAADVVSAQAGPGFTCYFPKGKVDRHLMVAAPVLKSDGARQVLQVIQSQPGRAAQDVAALTGLTPSTVNYHLKRLAGAGLVASVRSGRFTLLSPTPLGTQALGAWGRT